MKDGGLVDRGEMIVEGDSRRVVSLYPSWGDVFVV